MAYEPDAFVLVLVALPIAALVWFGAQLAPAPAVAQLVTEHTNGYMR